MRREINWRTRDADGNVYDVRVSRWGGQIRMSIREKGARDWDTGRKPCLEDWLELLDALERRHARRQATEEEIREVRAVIAGLGSAAGQ